MDIFKPFTELFNEPNTPVNDGKIIYLCVPTIPPYELISYLEQLGVIVKPVEVHIADDRTRTTTIRVSHRQFFYASGLIAGYSPNSVALLKPTGIKPITPRSRWGKRVTTKGFYGNTIKLIANIFGVEGKAPPKKVGKK